MLRPRKYSFGTMLDTFLLGATLAAIWCAVLVVIGAVLFWH
jgi:hypothetical protein